MRVTTGKTTMIRGKMSPVEYYIADSMEDFMGWVKQVPDRDVRPHTRLDDENFVGRTFDSWGAVYAALHTAWEHGIGVLDRMLGDLDDASVPKPISRKRRPRFREDDGDELDYDRLRSGQDAWRTTRRASTRGPQTVTVLCDIAASCRRNHDDILWRGAAAIALTHRLEEAGYRVELWAVDGTRELWNKGTIAGVFAVCLKRASDPIDRSTLISAVSGWAYRTFWFRAFCGGGHRSVSRILGYPMALTSEMLDEISRDANRILIDDAFTYDDAVAALRDALGHVAKGGAR
jgi:hypothetical protein